jgi:hypothetical protein
MGTMTIPPPIPSMPVLISGEFRSTSYACAKNHLRLRPAGLTKTS